MEELLNSFEQGLRSSLDPAIQPGSTYRYSLNGKIINTGGSNFSWESANGNKLIFSLPGRIIRGHIDSPSRLFLLTYYIGNPNLCEIGYVSKISTETENEYTPLYCVNGQTYPQGALGFSSENPYIGGYYNWETENVERLYWTDETTDPKVLNIARLKTTFVRDTLWQLKANYHYMILSGAIVDSIGVSHTIGSIFEKTFSIAAATSDVLIVEVEKVLPETLPFFPDYGHPIITYKEQIEGNLPTGTYYIGCRLTCDGYKSQFSPLLGPYTIFGYLDGLEWKDYRGVPGRSATFGIRFEINNIQSGFTKYEFCAFPVADNGALGDGVYFGPYDLNKSGSTTHDFTSTSGKIVNITEYIKNSVVVVKFKDMTVADKSMVIGNMDLFQYPGSSNKISGNIKQAVYEIPIDDDYHKYKSCNTVPDIDLNNGVNKDEILPRIFYKVFDQPVSYNGQTIPVGSNFEGIAGKPSFGGAGKVFPVYRIPKYLDKTNPNNPVQLFDEYVVKDALGYKGMMSNMMAGYFGEEKYRFGVLPISLKGTFMPVIWLEDTKLKDDFTFGPRNITSKARRYNADGSYSDDISFELVQNYTGLNNRKQVNARIAYALVDVDLTNIIDDISGFCIVRSKRDKTIISEGFAEPMFNVYYWKTSGEASDPVYVPERPRFPHQWVDHPEVTEEQLPESELLAYTSPSDLANIIDHSLEKEDYLKFARSFQAYDNFRKEDEEWYINKYTTAYYSPHVQGDVGDRKAPKDFFIHALRKVEVDNITEGENMYDFSNPANNLLYKWGFFYNTIRVSEWGNNEHPPHYDYGGKYIIMKVTGDTQYAIDSNTVHVYQFKRPKSNLYGGHGDTALEESTYIFTGHYQKITDDFKKAIKSGNNYIVQNVGIFGGDCFVNAFSYQHTYYVSDYHEGINYRKHHQSLIVKIPLQCEVNTAAFYGPDVYRNGDQHAFWTDPDPQSGDDDYFYEKFFDKWEIFSYAKQFSNDMLGLSFPGAGDISEVEDKFKARFYYSSRKVDGEKEDVYRVFPFNNFLDLDGKYGQIINIRNKMNKLFCFQEDMVSYIPVSERALATNQLGLPIQLGIGGRFVQSDPAMQSGNFFRHGLTEVSDGFVWFDIHRKEIMMISLNLEQVELNSVTGTKDFIDDCIHDEISDVIAGYDGVDKTVYITVTTTPESGQGGKIAKVTFGFNYSNKKFEGLHSIMPISYIPFKNRLITPKLGSSATDFYLNNVFGETKLFGSSFQSYLKFIVGSEKEGAKRFISMIIKGSYEFFDELRFETNYDYFTKTFQNVNIDTSSDINQNYQFVNNEWRFGIPPVGSEQFIDSIMQVTLKKIALDKKIKVNLVKTFYNKKY